MLSTSRKKPGVPKVAILNGDDTSFEFLQAIPVERQVVYGLGINAQVTARDIIVSSHGLEFTVFWLDGRRVIKSPLLGRFNVHNILAAISVALALNIEPEAIVAGVASVQ